MRTSDRRGLTLLEMVIGMAVLGSLGLVLLGLLRASVLSSGRASEQAFLLSTGRKALGGGDRYGGLLADIRGAARVESAESAALVLGTPGLPTLAYSLSPAGELSLSRGAVPEAPVKGLSRLSFGYYGKGPDYRVVESSAAAAVGLVLVSFEVPGRSRVLRLLSGARLMNHP